MSKDILTDAIGGIGDDLIAEAKARKPVMIYWRRVVATAACLAIIASLCYMFIPGIHRQDSPTKPTPHIIQISASTPTTPNNQIISTSPLRLSAPAPYQGYVGDEIIANDNAFQSEPAWNGFSVHVKALAVLPDTYLIERNRYRLVKMQTLDTMYGKNMMENFYLIIKEKYVTDFCKYDSLVLWNIYQCAYENQILYNATQGCYEVSEYALFDRFPSNRIFAITNGTFDDSLWRCNEAWLHDLDYVLQLLEEQGYAGWGIGYDSDVEFIKTVIGGYNNHSDHPPIAATLAEIECETAKEIHHYVEPFKNGIYIDAIFERSNQFADTIPDIDSYYTRYIYGYPTNEYIRINCHQESSEDYIVYSEEKFTDADLKNMPDLAAAMKAVNQAYDNGEIIPPHIENWMDYRLIAYSITGRYSKCNGNIYGLVHINWRFIDLNKKNKPYLYDDKYYVISFGSNEVISMDRDDVSALLTSESTIYSGQYDEHGKVIEFSPCGLFSLA